MATPIRHNGIVRVPKVWHEAAVEAFFDLQAKGGGSLTIPLPLKVFPYPKIRNALLGIYPEKFVPLFFKVGVISAEGSTGTKKGGGYPIDISVDAHGASAISTILHELRHLVQHLGDEVVKTKSGTFGRPTKAAVTSLRARKKAMKAGKIPGTGMQKYLSSASEWQPWVGTTADKIVGKIIAGGLTKTADVNAAIRAGILSSSFYGGTDPATRKELMRQVYSEVVRQLKGYTDIIPAKHPKAASAPKPASAPKAASAYTVRVKIEGAGPQIASEATYAGKDSKGRDKLEIPAADKDAALLTAESLVKLAEQNAKLHGGTIYAVRIAHNGKESELYVAGSKGASAPSAPFAAGSAPKGSAYVVRVKIVGAMPSIASEPTYAHKVAKDRVMLESRFDSKEEAIAAAHAVAAKATQGVTFHNGAVYRIGIYEKAAKKEHEVYDAGKGGSPIPGKTFSPKITKPVAAVLAKYPVIEGKPTMRWMQHKNSLGDVTTGNIPTKIGKGASAAPNPDRAILLAAGFTRWRTFKEPSGAGWEMKNPRRTRRPARRRAR